MGLKREDFNDLARKCFQTTEKHSVAVCDPFLGEKQFLILFVSFTGKIKNSCLNKSKFSSRFAPLKLVKKNKLSEYFCPTF